jgi:hypothetical protein
MAQNTKSKKQIAAKKAAKQQIVWAPGMPFGKWNYILLLVGIVVLAIGYILLSGGGSEDPAVFSDAIFDTRRLTIAPITLVLGLVIAGASILVKIKEKEAE